MDSCEVNKPTSEDDAGDKERQSSQTRSSCAMIGWGLQGHQYGFGEVGVETRTMFVTAKAKRQAGAAIRAGSWTHIGSREKRIAEESSRGGAYRHNFSAPRLRLHELRTCCRAGAARGLRLSRWDASVEREAKAPERAKLVAPDGGVETSTERQVVLDIFSAALDARARERRAVERRNMAEVNERGCNERWGLGQRRGRRMGLVEQSDALYAGDSLNGSGDRGRDRR